MDLRHKVVREVAIVYALVFAATFGVMRLRAIPAAKDYVHLSVGAIFLLAALHMARREGGLERFGMALGGLLQPPEDDAGNPGPFGLYELLRTLRRAAPSGFRETLVAVGLASIIFPPFAIGFAWWHEPVGQLHLSLSDDFVSFALAQLIVVGLPEEAFFRGYVQTRLAEAAGGDPKAALRHPAVIVAQSALFAVIHLVDFQWAKLAVFFPGLLFGLMRAWRGGIGAAIVLHALSNVYADFLERGWLHIDP